MFLNSGCVSSRAITQEQASEIAQRWAIQRHDPGKKVETVKFEDGMWLVFLDGGRYPGDHAMLKISPQGKILDVIGGR